MGMIRNCWHGSGKQALHMHSQESESAILQLYQHRASETDHGMENIVCDLLLSTCKAETDFCSCNGQGIQWAHYMSMAYHVHSVFLGPQLSPQFSSLRIFWKSKILIVYPFGDWSDVRLLSSFVSFTVNIHTIGCWNLTIESCSRCCWRYCLMNGACTK